MNKKVKSDIMLFITAFIWGSAFVAQSSAMDHIGAFTFNGIRTYIGALTLIPVIFVLNKLSQKDPEQAEITDEEKATSKKYMFIGGLACGSMLYIASALQQLGLFLGTTAGKAGFITSLYIVMVPLLGLFIGKKVKPIIWVCVALGTSGLYLLTMKGELRLEQGDFLMVLCAVAFGAHILIVDHFSPKTNGVKLSFFQFITCGTLSFGTVLLIKAFYSQIQDASQTVEFLGTFLNEVDFFRIENFQGAIVSILYAGVMSSGVAYTLQVVAQKHAEPSVASLIMSLEAVFAVICGMLILGETMTTKEIIGCLVMFAAIILAQLPSKSDKLEAKR